MFKLNCTDLMVVSIGDGIVFMFKINGRKSFLYNIEWNLEVMLKNNFRISLKLNFPTSKRVALRSWTIFHLTLIGPVGRAWRAGSTLEMDSEHKNKKIGFYPKSLRPFLGFYALLTIMHVEGSSLGSARTSSTPSLRFAGNHLYLRFGSIFVHK